MMRWSRSAIPIRVRLALWYSAALLLTLGLIAVAGQWTLRDALLADVDETLKLRMEIVRDDMSASMARPNVTIADSTRRAYIAQRDQFAGPDIYIQVLDPMGRTLATSPSLQERRILLSPSILDEARENGIAVATIRVGREQVRVLVAPIQDEETFHGFVGIGESLAMFEHLIGRFQWLLGVSGVIGLVVALLGGWLLTDRALAPISQMTRIARQIAETRNFDQRLTVGADDEVGRLATTFNDMIERIDESLRRQHEFLADTSHELRNPLTVVRSNLELLAMDLPPTDRRESLREASEEVARMSRLVADLLFLAEADAQEAIAHELVDIAEIVMATARQARQVSREHQIVVEIESAAAIPREDLDRERREDALASAASDTPSPLMISGDAPTSSRVGLLPGATDQATGDAIDTSEFVVWGDRDRMKQLLWNLVENAIRYTPAGGTVTLSLRRHGNIAEVSVTDTGIGIPLEYQERVFERFFRIDRARSRAAGGSGLGLAIVKQIAEAHGGQVRVRSSPGVGSTFSTLLPLAESLSGTESLARTSERAM
jgi:signal transduction histidine kinase